MLSDRVAETLVGAKESWTRRMFELAAKLRADGGGPVYDLSLGNPSLEPPKRFREAVRELLVDEPPGQHRYMTNAGFPDVRAFIADREAARYDQPFAGDDVVMTVGAAGGINVLFRVMLNAGDEVVVPAPYFSEYDHYCANVGASLVPAPTNTEFSLNLERLDTAIGPKTRIVLLNSPNNPTGTIYDAESLDRLGTLLRERSDPGRPIVVVEDSPYRDLVHDGSEVPSMLQHYDNTILVTSHSKDLGLAGERIGYIAISPKVAGRKLVARGASFCNRVLGFVNAPALMQRMLPKVLGQPDGRVDVAVYAARCQQMAEGLAKLGFDLPPVRAGFFLFPRLPRRLADSSGGDVKLTDKLREARTIVVPGTAFGVPGHLRLSMCVDEATVDGALAAFRRVCEG